MKQEDLNNNDLYEIFLEQLQNIKNAETQIVQALPTLIRQASNEELKKTLSTQLTESKAQVERLEKVSNLLAVKRAQRTCETMKCLTKEAEELTNNMEPSPVLDSAIIAAVQKIKHYEIACYGTLQSFANQLEIYEEALNLMKESLNEEIAADKKLTKIAEGSLFSFSGGVNKLAAAGSSHSGKRY